MNLFSIACKNIKKSRRDYSVYFLTLILGVAIFYMFNSLGSQGAMTSLSRSTTTAIRNMVKLIEIVSVVVAIVLGLLMVYANNFLIKRRKKEFGLYMLLGMGRKKVSRILILETGLVGLMSLGIGLFLGIFFSQFLSIIIGKLFDLELSGYRFSVSPEAIVKTIVNFILIFLAVLVFNASMVSRYKLIDLLNAEKQQEKVYLKNTKVSVIVFLLSVTFLGFADIRVGFFGQMQTRNEFFACIILGIVFTFTFFWSLSGFIFDILQKWKSCYHKGLTAFTIRQFSGNVNSSVLSTALICLILFFAITAFSTGFALRAYINARLGGGATPVSCTVLQPGEKVTETLAKNGYPVNSFAKEYLEVPIYRTGEVTMRIMLGDHLEEAAQTFRMAAWDNEENIMSQSDYNALMVLYKRPQVDLQGNHYLVINDVEIFNQFQDKALADNTPITVNGITCYPLQKKSSTENLLLSGLSSGLGVTIFPDEVFEGLSPRSYLFAANYLTEDKAESYEVDYTLEEKLNIGYDENGELKSHTSLQTKNEVRDSALGNTVMVVFLVLYIGIVFVMTCAAILALRVLSDTIDSRKKYAILSRIGVTEKMQKKALFIQVLLNFLLPLLLGMVHTFFALRYIRGVLMAFGLINVGTGAIFTAFVMLFVYGGYFLLTYSNCKRLIRIDG